MEAMGETASFWELKTNFEALQNVAEKQESRVQYQEARAQSIAMAYLIWQRLLFFAVSRATSPCSHWWMVLCLSLGCAVVYFFFFIEAVTMLFRVQCQMDIICKEQSQICHQILAATAQSESDHKMGDSGDVGFQFQLSFHMKLVEYGGFKMVARRVFVYSVVSALLLLTALELYASYRLLCTSY